MSLWLMSSKKIDDHQISKIFVSSDKLHFSFLRKYFHFVVYILHNFNWYLVRICLGAKPYSPLPTSWHCDRIGVNIPMTKDTSTDKILIWN